MNSEELQATYEAERDSEARRWWKDHHDSHIYAWNPGLTMRAEQHDKELQEAHLKLWTEQWFKERGFRVTFVPEPKNAFTLEKL